jgi:ABC-type polysaccharide/polyol phosphate export permease
MLFLRRARGVLGTAVVWRIPWFVMGGAVGLYGIANDPTKGRASDMRFVGWMALGWALWGFLSGAIFALAVAVLERRRTLAQLSVRRAALWGALGAVALPTAFLGFVWTNGGSVTWLGVAVTLPVSAALGAGCAAGTLALAQRGAAKVDQDAGAAA